jgi:uncharacterized protein
VTLPLAIELIAIGLGVGLLAGYFGVGGGILMVPLMVLILDMTQHLAEGTSLLVIVPTAIAGVARHVTRGYVSYATAMWMAAGGVGGAFLGVAWAHRLTGNGLQIAFATFLALMGIRLIRQGIVGLRSPVGPPKVPRPPEVT